MTIDRKVDENGAITDVITTTDEEDAAIEQAQEIIKERFRQLGVEQTAWEKDHLVFALQGRLRFDGIDGMLDWARTATISVKKNTLNRGYC